MGSGASPEQFAQMFTGVMLVVSLLIMLVGLGLVIFICWLLSSCYQRIPEQFRKMSPGLVWLLLIPCFNIIWLFFVLPRLSQSFKAYFDSVNRTDVGDCGEKLAWIYCIGVPVTFVLGLIPILGLVSCLLGPALLVIFIIYLVKVVGLKNQVQAA